MFKILTFTVLYFSYVLLFTNNLSVTISSDTFEISGAFPSIKFKLNRRVVISMTKNQTFVVVLLLFIVIFTLLFK